MPQALTIVAPLLVAAVLVASAVGKLRDPARAAAGFEALDVPRPLRAPGLVRAHPWAEIVLAALLLVTSGPAGFAIAALALALMVVYLVLVARALRKPEDVDCGCFGSLGGQRITGMTVARNAWLTVLAGVGLLSVQDGGSVVTRVSSLDSAGAWWLLAVFAAVLTVGLVLGVGGPGSAASDVGELRDDIEYEDYIRARIPAVAVTLADGSTTDLRRLSSERAQLLLYVSEGCGSCRDVIAEVPRWRAAMPQIDIRLVVGLSPVASSLSKMDPPVTAHDPDHLVRDTFGISGTPAALLLGADGLLAGGPVMGRPAVEELVTEIEHELYSASRSQG